MILTIRPTFNRSVHQIEGGKGGERRRIGLESITCIGGERGRVVVGILSIM